MGEALHVVPAASAADPSVVHGSLRRATAAAHRRTEALLDAPRRCRHRDTYRELVRWLTTVHTAAAEALDAVDGRTGRRLGVGDRARLTWLRTDLRALGDHGREHRWSAQVRDAILAIRPDSVADAVGMQYVVEGSALGGRALAAIAARELGIGPHNGGRFLRGHGASTGHRWRAWWQRLPSVITPADVPGVVAGARATFAGFEAAAGALVRGGEGVT
jgi:heme oxygenase